MCQYFRLAAARAKQHDSPLGSRSGTAGFSLVQAPRSLELWVKPLPFAGKRLGMLVKPSRDTTAFQEAFARTSRRAVRPQETSLQQFLRPAAFREAALQVLQRIAQPLEASPSSARARRNSGRRASSFSTASQSSWGSPPAPSPSRGASGGDLQSLQRAGKSLELRLQSLHDRLLGPKNRLQQLRGHLQLLEAHLQELEASPKGVRTALSAARGLSGTIFHQLHETSLLGLR